MTGKIYNVVVFYIFRNKYQGRNSTFKHPKKVSLSWRVTSSPGISILSHTFLTHSLTAWTSNSSKRIKHNLREILQLKILKELSLNSFREKIWNTGIPIKHSQVIPRFRNLSNISLKKIEETRILKNSSSNNSETETTSLQLVTY